MVNRNMHSLRVPDALWMDRKRFEELLSLIKRYPCGIAQLSLFTASTHPPLQLSELSRRADIMKERMEEIRRHGLGAGINLLATIGHHEEDLENCFRGEYHHMTNDAGDICRGSFCMNDERYIEDYVRPAYRILAKAGPDHIWIDDDVRYGHLPVGIGCFCDGCIESFNQKNQTGFTRDTLREALDEGDLELRRAWLAFNADKVYRLLHVIGKTVREIDSGIKMGWMTGERYFEGYDFKRFADALSDGGKYEIMWRPGGGAYTDYSFDEIVEKAEEMGRQNAFLPACVTLVQSEIENFPYQLIKKTPTSTALEAALSMTVGCTGAAFNILPSETGEPVATIEPFLKTIDGMQPFYQLLAEKTGGKRPSGICTGWRIDSQAAVPKGRWTRTSGGMYASFAREMFDFGLPQCYDVEQASVVLMKGRSPLLWTDGEMEKLLARGLYLDAGALQSLQERGFGAHIGFAVGKEFQADAREHYLPSEVNRFIENGVRNCRQAFNAGEAFGIELISEKAELLANLIDYHDEEMASCCLGMYENNLGGCICASGYYPFSWVSDYRKTVQLKRIFIKLSKGMLPSYVDSYCRIRNHTFVEEDKCIVTLCNPTNESLSSVRVAVRTTAEKAELYTQQGRCMALESEAEGQEGGNYHFFTVDRIPPYEMVIIEAWK